MFPPPPRCLNRGNRHVGASARAKRDVSNREVRERRNEMRIVQFIHPRQEFPVSETNSELRADGRYDVAWNTGRHCRRLVKHLGDYVDDNGVLQQNAELTFWTEWEGPTVATRLNSVRDAIHAWYLHEIQHPVVPAGMENTRRDCCDDSDDSDDGCGDGLQNTDPCVFGDTFKYSNCQQSSNGVLRKLGAGSLILFVSRIQREYYLDTVFVTQAGVDYTTNHVNNIVCSDQYRDLTLKRLPLGRNFTFYRGVGFTADCPVYSFVPSRRYTGDVTDYIRCRLDAEAINRVAGCEVFSLGLTQKFKCTVADPQLVREVWTEIGQQIREQEFVKAIHFGWPQP